MSFFQKKEEKHTRAKGADAEKFVARSLEKQGFEIVAKNYLIRGGEIDLIAKKENLLIFVEVRSWEKAYWQGGSPLETISPQKIRHIRKTALHYIMKNNVSLQQTTIRFDVAALIGSGTKFQMNYIENAFGMDQ